MYYLYLATTFAGALVCLLASLLLFARRREGERSRVILAVIVSFSVFNYITRFIALCNGIEPEFVVTAPMLLRGYFMMICYIMYPIEVIYPGWLNLKRILIIFSFLLLMLGVYQVSLWAGVNYTPYRSLLEMVPYVSRFDAWFRLLLSLFIVFPAFVLIFVHRIRRYSNTDRIWLKKYSITLSINILAYFMVLAFTNPILHTLYYYASVGCSLYIVYMELFDRLIGKSLVKTVPVAECVENKPAEFNLPESDSSLPDSRSSVLSKRLDVFMKKNKAWRDPDLSLNMLASELCTNRTTLAQVLRDNESGGYTNYVNKLRIDDFVEQIESGNFDNFQEAFFFAGFRSRNTALRNFRQFTGMTPSEYFLKKDAI